MSGWMYDTYEEASAAVETACMDCAADMGEEMVEAAYGDIVHSIASCCPEDVAEELIRRKL